MRRLQNIVLATLLALGLCGVARAQDAAQAVSLAEAFSRAPLWSQPALSPDGSRLAVVVQRDGERRLDVVDVDDGLRRLATLDLGDRYVRGVDWIDNGHVYYALRRPTEQVAATLERLSYLEGFRPYVLDVEARSAAAALSVRTYPPYAGRYGSGYWRNQDGVLRTPRAPGEPLLLSAYRSANVSGERGEPEVVAYDVATGEATVAVRSRRNIYAWEVDQQGRVRVASGYDDGRRVLEVYDLAARSWVDLSARVAEPLQIFRPLAFAADPDQLYVASNHEGDPGGLYTYTISTGEMSEAIAAHPLYEIGGVDFDVEGRLRTAYAGDVVIPLSEEAKAFWSHAAQEFRGKYLSILQSSLDGSRTIVAVSAQNDPGSYYLYDRASDSFRELQRRFPWLDGVARATTAATAYEARDGLVIPAYVTLPTGIAEGAAAPFVVMPHGGPWSRDFADYDPLVQLLASSGFGVLQMNFRGSSGYGAAYTELGAREWGRAMQDDVVDGARWLVEQGLADPERMCIVGWSYGGYAALMGAARDDDLFRCAASIAGVTDLQRLVIEAEDDALVRYVGGAWRDREELRAYSPLHRAEEIDIPILLVHGMMDPVVPFEHANSLRDALTDLGRPPRTVLLALGDHDLERPEERRQLYEALSAFLEESLSPRE